MQIPCIPEEEKTPIVLQLIEIIEQILVVNHQQSEQIQLLKDEIARLKGQKPKPNIKPSKLESLFKDKEKKDSSGKRPGSDKRSKTAEIIIHDTIPIAPEYIPPGSTFKEHQPYTVVGIKIEPYNVRYLLERWQTPDGNYIVGKLPPEVQGHFDSELKRYILYQYFQCHVTQPLLLEQLLEWEVDISSGQLNRILIEDKDVFHLEKDKILSAGLKVSDYVNVDDTGARHDGKNGYCTHIGNELFAWFQSTDSKSRINFLELLRAGQKDYVINEDALEYMNNQGLAKSIVHLLKDHCRKQFADITEWGAHLKELQIVNHRHVKIATEGALIGSVLCSGLPRSLVIVSDDAGQFNVFNHALCWIHAERLINKLIAPSEEKRKILEDVKEQIWDFYAELKEYKVSPNKTKRIQLQERFREIFTQKTDFQTLNLALRRLYENRDELLLVLDRPEIPLHNNLSENDIREYVKRRKVSGSTRSELGRQCRDTFTSLKKTCRKLGVSFWEYLMDRITKRNEIPLLPELILNRANSP
jgi:uncharacterized small protein (DUF1192 family)